MPSPLRPSDKRRRAPAATDQPAHGGAGALDGLRLSTRAIRSGLRRYPPELLGSFLRRGVLASAGSARPPAEVRDLLSELAPHGMALIWLGHASVMATLGPITIVVDPVLSERIGPRILGRTWGLSRRAPAPVAPASLAGADLLLLTHAHFDHLDRPTLEGLASDRTTVIAPIRCASLVPHGFARVIELAPGASYEHGGATIHALEAAHWGARLVLDRGRGTLAYAVKHAEGSILFAGDTAFTTSFARAHDLIGPIDVAAFGIGAYDPWEHMHATPEQVWRMFTSIGARFLLPIHHSTFELSDEPLDEPVRRLLAVAGDDGARVMAASPGEILVMTKPAG
ncbi:MAG: MBL fold metallo-hydrolase [Phycisphaeraceae bacterium]|nr:MBL fold metallo-hydrolase [Phycisphaeraceae bacterium]